MIEIKEIGRDPRNLTAMIINAVRKPNWFMKLLGAVNTPVQFKGSGDVWIEHPRLRKVGMTHSIILSEIENQYKAQDDFMTIRKRPEQEKPK